MDRRKFLSTSTKITCACASLGITAGIFSSCSSPISSDLENSSGLTLELDISSSPYDVLQNIGGSVATEPNEIDSKGILLFRPD